MKAFKRYTGFTGDVMLLFAASGVLTVALLVLALVLVPGPHAAVDWVLSKNVHNGTAAEVARCIQRNAGVGDAGIVRPFCRAKHSVAVYGSMDVVARCEPSGRIAITARNTSPNVIFTSFALRVNDEPIESIHGQWLTPGSNQDYPLQARCLPGQSITAVSLERRGVMVDSGAAGFEEPADPPGMGTIAEPREPVTPISTQTDGSRAIDGSSIPTEEPATARATSQDPPELAAGAGAGGSEAGTASSVEPKHEAVQPETLARAEIAGPTSTPPAPQEPPAEPQQSTPAAGEASQAQQPALRLALTEVAVRESDGVAVVRLDVLAAASAPGWVEYSTRADSAEADVDFVSISGRIDVRPGDEGASILIPIIDDALPEPDKAFLLRIDAVSDGLSLQGPAQARVRILDDD